MENNQADGDHSVRGATHYDITMGNDIARDAHCDITMSNDTTWDIHCDVTMLNDIAMNPFYNFLLCITMPIYVILLCIIWNNNKNKFMFDQFGLENTFVVFV